jgi:hypothetical protein
MKKGLILRVLALGMLAGACDEDDQGIGVGTSTASVRFVNALSGSTGSLGFTANGAAVGTGLGFGSMSSQCAQVQAGARTLAFGTAATGGGISGTAFTTQSHTFTAGGDFTVIATGTATAPQFVVLNNDAFSGTVTSGQTAVRFVNLVPRVGTATTASNFNVFTGTTTTGTPTAASLAFGGTSTFTQMASGTPTFTFTNATGGTQVFSGGGLNLTSGGVNTIAILPNAAGTGYQLINITGC